MALTRNVPLLERTLFQVPTMNGQINVVAQKAFVITARPKAMMWHGTLVLIINLDTQTIVSPWDHRLVILVTSPLVIMMDIALHAIIVALILVATLMIDMIAGNTIASQLLVTAKAKTTMPNIEADLDQGQIMIQVLFS